MSGKVLCSGRWKKKIHLLNLIIFPLPFAFCHTHTHTLTLPHLFTRALILIKKCLPLLPPSSWVRCLCMDWDTGPDLIPTGWMTSCGLYRCAHTSNLARYSPLLFPTGKTLQGPVSELCGRNQNAKAAKVIWGKEKRKSFPESLLEGCLPCSAAVMSQLVLLSEITDINCCGQATQLDFSQMAQMKVSITLI